MDGREAVGTSEERYRSLLQSIDAGFCIVRVLFDEEGEAVDYLFLETNPAFEVQTGMVGAEGRRMRELVPRHEDHWFRIYGRVARTGKPERFVQQARHLGDRWYDVYALRVGAPEERTVAILFEDITDQRRAEDELRERAAELRAAKVAAEQASETKSRFLSTISHEFRTPLNAMVGLAELMEDEIVGPVNEKQRDYLARIQASARNLVSLIDEVLTLSRSESGREPVEAREVNVTRLCGEVVEMLRPGAEAKGLELRFRAPSDPAAIVTDAGKVRQILMNLIGNAIKYTEAGHVEVTLGVRNEILDLRVGDTGPGIPETHRDRVFEPFFRMEGPSGGGQRGTGLGLAICRRLAHVLGGEILLESRPGEGSTFTLRLPPAPGGAIRGAHRPPGSRSTP